jgi:hypothetical protein
MDGSVPENQLMNILCHALPTFHPKLRPEIIVNAAIQL